MLADLVCAETVAWLPDTNQAMVTMQRSCIEWLGRSQTEPTTESSWNTVCYLAGPLTKFRATVELTSSIVDTLVSCKTLPYSLALLEASFCHATPGLHDQDLQSVLAKPTTYVEQTEAPYFVGPQLRLNTLLSRYLDTDDQIQLLSSYGRTILMIALKPMVGRTGELLWADNVVATSTLLENLLKKRDILTLKRARSCAHHVLYHWCPGPIRKFIKSRKP